MPLSPSTSSSSSSHAMDFDVPCPHHAETTPMRAPEDGSDTDDDDDDDDDGSGSTPRAALITSRFRSQKSLAALCKKFGINRKDFTPLPAGDRRACSAPPPGAICMYAEVLEAGMLVPLHPFFSDVLSHFGVAPSQIVPNGWRVMAGFLALSCSAGVPQPPPVAVFRHFFSLCTYTSKGWYCFRKKDAAPAGALFTGLLHFIKRWKEGFFFLESSEPWPCPVVWGEPTRNAVAEPGLTAKEKAVAARMLRARGAAPIDLRVYLNESNIAAAMMIDRVPPLSPSPNSPSRRATVPKGAMDPSTYATMQNMRRAGKTAVKESAEEVAVKSEPSSDGDNTPDWAPSPAKKRNLLAEEIADSHRLRRCSGRNARGSVSGARASAPPGFHMHPGHRKPGFVTPDFMDGDTADWEESRRLLKSVVTPSRERAFTAAEPSDVIESTYTAVLQAANYASFSLDHARRLRDELEEANAKLADPKKAMAAEVDSARAAAVEEFLGSEEHERRLAEAALKGYERGVEDMKRVALALRPDIDAARLVVPPGGFQ